ncbi:PREDICTED: NADH dehydrogenase [ubiquinone] 1 alpha subcomplex subunit 4-like 2 [Amphimedon queenslandica]|uniref:NADH dehydrogenase [ubiquinone] 1 alpha subcomplex subunit 4 n=1 Tax=Amphimedon queenslandica TaxID=400682 RepID=A0A1X7U4L4_AMPQE|nr:PREDICTED: NADH dehydrogenase [ubiquinone] 1 alpha subcomplex subunit 4-like 2 [Amphimedon queenslandica]|eukprot:XP_003389064.1 PREDICTED: NADH dehydrogenase [ubiquinone] 1 alpha subcomplex subunit 4-like 2 [Amphimedon queenslandica]
MSKFIRTLKSHPAVIPVVFFTGLGASMAAFQILRACNVYSDVSFRRGSNPHPWLNVKPNENLKYYKAVDYGKLSQGDRPKY